MRRSTETKAATKTTEFFIYLAMVAALLIAAAIVDQPTRAAMAPARPGST